MRESKLKSIVGDKIFYCEFIKNDGSLRKMKCRLGVKKYLNGGQLKYNTAEQNNLIVFDMEKRDYRTIKCDNIVKIKARGFIYSRGE